MSSRNTIDAICFRTASRQTRRLSPLATWGTNPTAIFNDGQRSGRVKKQNIVRCLLAVVTISLLMFVTHLSAGEIQNIRGRFEGFTQSTGNPDTIPVEQFFDISSQDHRRFDAIYCSNNLMPAVFDVRGTIAASGIMHAYGESDTEAFCVDWKWQEFPLGAAILDGYSKTIGDSDEFLHADILLRDFPFDPEKPSAVPSGRHVGTGTSTMNGTVQTWSMDLRRRDDSRTGFAGTVSRGDEAGIIIIDGRGTLDGDGNTVMIGVDTGSRLKILARYYAARNNEPARIEGTYQVFAIRGGNQGPGGPDTLEDTGTFVVTEVADEDDFIGVVIGVLPTEPVDQLVP